MLEAGQRHVYASEHHQFRESVRRFIDREFLPNFTVWEQKGVIDRSFWISCGEAGILCPTVPEAYGGLGLDFRYNAVIDEEFGYHGILLGISLQSDIVADYIVHYGNEDQKRLYLPKMISGELVTAIAMTEPDAGSDCPPSAPMAQI